MSFVPEMDSIYMVIRKAISDLGYIPVRIDKKEHNNEISGEILNEIKNSYFIIADVTGQRNGVYFEAGFAKGHNKPVIWCCAKKEEKSVHFDTRQYNHIFWENEQQLYEKLKDRILGTITIKE
jgi:nucleoside 2-deoxyribosyltransferase